MLWVICSPRPRDRSSWFLPLRRGVSSPPVGVSSTFALSTKTMTIDKDNISNLRSFNQQITDSRFKTAKGIAGWLGAIQAQDYNMVKWALGMRIQNSTENLINNEIDSGSIIRTHLLRPTWHIVSSNDIYWMQGLTAPQIKSSLQYRDKQLGLTDTIFRKCNRIFEKTLRDRNHKTREELVQDLKKAKIDVDDNRASHIFLRAEIDGIICSGKQKEGKPTYAILEEWVPIKNRIYRDEALKELALRYFTSRGPATIQDFSWWSGLSLGNSKLALELSKSNLISGKIENNTFWFADSSYIQKQIHKEIYLLPAYDEFLISYRDRTACLSSVYNKRTISENGMFYPTILYRGQIIGTWKRNFKGNNIILTFNLYKSDKTVYDKIYSKSTSQYSKFYYKTVEPII